MSKESIMYPIKKILLPTDGSKYSLHAAKYAAQIAKKHGSDVMILHVLELSLADYPIELCSNLSFVRLAVPDETKIKERGRKAMGKTKEVLSKSGISAETKYYCCGNPRDVIIETTIKENINLIIMGHKGLTVLEHIRLGSVAEGVMRSAPCPVLIVR